MGKSGPKPRLSSRERSRLIRMAAHGASYRELAAEFGLSWSRIGQLVRPVLGYRVHEERSSPHRLSLEDRCTIRSGLDRGLTLREIGRLVGRHASTICREVKANGGPRAYAPVTAHRRAGARACRPKPTKLGSNPRLCAQVVEDLQRWWSPEQIARRLKEEFKDDPAMWVSHETIYQSIYVQGRGELRKELARCLRTGRASRKQRGDDHRGRIPDMVMISDRPAEADDRAIPGHWEGDLIMGKDGKSAIGTLVERSTRYVMLLHLPHDRTAESVRDAIINKVPTLPQSLWRTLTWDQGKELAEHAKIRIDTGVDVYFCDPHSPWQRGSNENTNGLLRQYFPKRTDLSVHDEQRLEEVADSLNGRPRKTLGWKTPSEKLAELVASTA
jgi:transposase, IS30 family